MNGKVTTISRYHNGELIHKAKVALPGPIFGPNECRLAWWDRWETGTNRPVPETLKVVARPGSGRTRGGMQ